MCRRQGGNGGRGEVGRDEILLKVPLKRCHYARVALRTLWLFQFPLDLGNLALKADFGLVDKPIEWNYRFILVNLVTGVDL